MSTYDQFLEARALCEALHLKHALECNPRPVSSVTERAIERTFAKLASQLGYRVERIMAPVKEKIGHEAAEEYLRNKPQREPSQIEIDDDLNCGGFV